MMSDDLVKRLQQPWDTDRSIISQTGRWMTERKEAADRIKEIEAERDALKAKLEAAVQTISKVREDVNWMLNETRFLNHRVFDYLDTTLEELSSVSCANTKEGSTE